jgi:type IV pilus assembly protein PilE
MKTPIALRCRGFTLVELLIVMVIIAILASIAIPSYRQHVMKVKRADAMVELTAWGQRMERCYTRYNRFNAFDPADTTCAFAPYSTQDGTYQITQPTSAAQQFVFTATPQGAQANDSRCMALSVDETGRQSVSGSYIATPEKCW